MTSLYNQSQLQQPNYASTLPALINDDIRFLIGTTLSNIVITQYRRTLPVLLFMQVDMDVDICNSISYMCEDLTDIPQIEDSAMNTGLPRHTIKPPRIVTFQGYCVGGFETKISKDQLTCLNRYPLLRNWYNNSLARSIEDGRQSLLTRFYRYIEAHGIHPRNTGNRAGHVTQSNYLGTLSEPVHITEESIDTYHVELISTVREMPRMSSVPQEYGASTEDMFVLTHPSVEFVMMKADVYNKADTIGSCNTCSYFKDVFNKKPRGITYITSYCVESYRTQDGSCVIYPALFGRRYHGFKGGLRIVTDTYESPDKESVLFKVKFYWQAHVWDSRCLGKSYITVDSTKPPLKMCNAAPQN